MAADVVNQTTANLAYAYSTETLARRRYLAFAAIAEGEGDDQLGAMFRTLAERRGRHARGHLEALGAYEERGQTASSTGNNLRAAIASALHDHADRYPGMARTARDEGFDDIADWFETIAKSRRSHAQRFQRALDLLTGSRVVGFGT
ncbi:MAG TPA: rubrerythrin family protein [Acetobacteraceae bacterium]|jgi:rubrerythrin|nr:rubrerythrin family protein [Acetobacteraceae bacterium]